MEVAEAYALDDAELRISISPCFCFIYVTLDKKPPPHTS